MNPKTNRPPLRAESLDALRGLTIAMMVLCGAIIMWVLPAWMSHCQEPPPDSAFHPEIYGITWVDLVFPFFLFSMGAAFPFSLGGKIDRGVPRLSLLGSIASRAAKLTFFAIYLQHVYPWASQCPDDTLRWVIGLGAFILLFPCFTRFPFIHNEWIRRGITVAGYAAATLLMFWSNSFSGAHYELSAPTVLKTIECGVLFLLPMAFARVRYARLRRWLVALSYAAAAYMFCDLLNHCEITGFLWSSNIIILVLADMALFGMVLYMLTYRSPRTRLAFMAILLGFFLSADTPGSWQQDVYGWTPLPWFYQMRYLKYLFVVIPGVYAGEWLRGHLLARSEAAAPSAEPKATGRETTSGHSRLCVALTAILGVAVIVVNLWGLFVREMGWNLLLSAIVIAAVAVTSRRCGRETPLLVRLTNAGAFLLLLGLAFEAYQGGIRKDDPTYSYYFVTSGLAFYMLSTLYIVCDVYRMRRLMSPLTMAGKNPMIAYVATSLFIVPVLDLLGIGDQHIDFWASTPFLGFMRGFLLTVLAVATAAFFTRIKWFWRT